MFTASLLSKNISRSCTTFKQSRCGLIFIITTIISGSYNEEKSSFVFLSRYYIILRKTRRITAVSCECGLVKIAIVNVVDLQVSRSWLLRYDKPVPSVIVFPHRNVISKPIFIANCKYLRCTIYSCNII